MKVSAHSCLLDKECRGYGVPGFTYLNFGRRVIRFNPPYSKHYLRHNKDTNELELSGGWTWHVIETWRSRA